MFENIINILKNSDSGSDKKKLEMIDKISKMNLTDMRAYMKSSMQGFEPSEEGVIEILKKLTTVNEETSERYLANDDMDSKIKNCFELVLVIASDIRITIDAIELIQEFINVYADIIADYDTKYKQIYGLKLKNSIKNAIRIVNTKTDFSRKENVLNDSLTTH
ncbi:MAG: hypothetical protein NTW78_01075 [Campylobacterales bacterium]|nr:hypothetical protein [Campylobacterales bacterium]